jgi:hypothetical protein
MSRTTTSRAIVAKRVGPNQPRARSSSSAQGAGVAERVEGAFQNAASAPTAWWSTRPRRASSASSIFDSAHSK